jgi:WD40 repeat protein/serine/threonine protein kinase
VEEYLEQLRAGRRPSRQEFLVRYAEVAPALAECLDGLEFIQSAASRLAGSAPELPPDCAAPSELGPGQPLGDFRIVRELGRGGMGVVYEAVPLSLGRRVALKVLPFASALDTRQVQRFKNEAQAAAHLHHSNIVPVFGVGCERSVHYYAMQFIEGHTLADAISEWRSAGRKGAAADLGLTALHVPKPDVSTTAPAAGLSTERSPRGTTHFTLVAGLGVQAAEALEHAHQMGVTHRDVKPANLMVDGRGHLWVSDFGLAHVQGDAGLTMTGDLVGTLRYMSPEQALANRVPVDHRTDVYSLGATLYELLTLEPAVAGHDRREVMRRIAFEEPRPPRRLNRAIPADLETVVLKALAKAPQERYATCQEMADDLRRWLDDRPIRARRPTPLQRLRKWARRHRAGVACAAGSLAAVLVLAVAGLAAANAVLRKEQRRTKEALDDAHRASYGHRVALAHRCWEQGDVPRAGQLLEECPLALRHWEWSYVHRLCRAEVLDLRGHNAGVNMVAFSPDGRHLASVADGVRVWDAATGREVFLVAGRHGVAFSPGGPCLACADGDGVQVYDVTTGKHLLRLQDPGDVASVAFSPDGRRLASAGTCVLVRDAADGAHPLRIDGHAGRVVCVAFSPAGDLLATAGQDRAVKLWDALTGKEQRTFRGLEGKVNSVAFDPGGTRLAAAAEDRTVKVWDARTGEQLLTLPGRPWNVFHLPVGIRTLAFSPDGRHLAVAGGDRIVRVWDATTGHEVYAFRGHTCPVRGVAFSPDGRRLASAGEDQAVKVWDVTAGTDARSSFVDKQRATSLAVSGSGRWCAAAGTGGVDLWDLAAGRVSPVACEAGRRYRNPAFHKDGRSVAAVATDGSVQVIDVATGRAAPAAAGNMRDVFDAAFTADLKRVARASGNVVQVTDLATGGEVTSLPRPARPAVAVMSFASEGDRLALVSDHGARLEVWDVVSGQELLQLDCSAAPVFSLAFSPDGTRLAAVGRPCENAPDRVTLWDAATGVTVLALGGPTAVGRSSPLQARCLAFSPDGRRLAAAGEELITLWNTATGQELLTLRGHARDIRFLAFTEDSARLLSASEDGEVRVWDATPR